MRDDVIDHLSRYSVASLSTTNTQRMTPKPRCPSLAPFTVVSTFMAAFPLLVLLLADLLAMGRAVRSTAHQFPATRMTARPPCCCRHASTSTHAYRNSVDRQRQACRQHTHPQPTNQPHQAAQRWLSDSGGNHDKAIAHTRQPPAWITSFRWKRGGKRATKNPELFGTGFRSTQLLQFSWI